MGKNDSNLHGQVKSPDPSNGSELENGGTCTTVLAALGSLLEAGHTGEVVKRIAEISHTNIMKLWGQLLTSPTIFPVQFQNMMKEMIIDSSHQIEMRDISLEELSVLNEQMQELEKKWRAHCELFCLLQNRIREEFPAPEQLQPVIKNAATPTQLSPEVYS